MGPGVVQVAAGLAMYSGPYVGLVQQVVVEQVGIVVGAGGGPMVQCAFGSECVESLRSEVLGVVVLLGRVECQRCLCCSRRSPCDVVQVLLPQ